MIGFNLIQRYQELTLTYFNVVQQKIGLGLIFGGLSGRFLKPRRRYQRVEKAYSFEGLPFGSDKESDEESPEEAEKA